jgi:hypothetical protein
MDQNPISFITPNEGGKKKFNKKNLPVKSLIE